MAYVNSTQIAPGPNIKTEEQQAPIAAGGAGIGGSTKSPATPGQNVPAQPSAQLSAYLAANQPQSAALAQNVAGTVGGQINAAGAAIDPAVNTYTGQLYTVPTDASVNSAVESSPSSLTPDQTATFKKEAGAAGKSPNPAGTFETTQGYQDVTSGIQKAVEQANLWGAGNDVASLSAALTPFEGGNATIGDRTLDSLLLSQTPDAYKKITAATAPAAGLQGRLDAGTSAANTALQNSVAQNTATTAAAKASGGKYAENLNNTLAGYLAQAQKDADAYNSGVNKLSTGVANIQPQISGLMDAVAAYNVMQGSNPATALLPKIQYGEMGKLPSTVSAPSIGQLASQGQYSDVAALLDLLGADAPNLPINPANASMAGTYTSPINSIPAVNSIIAPFSNPVGPGLLQAEGVYSSHLNNPALANSRSSYEALQAAYQAMQDAAIGKIPINPNQVAPPPPVPTPGQPSTVAPVPPTDLVPGTPEAQLWIKQNFPDLYSNKDIDANGNSTLPPGKYGLL